MKSLILLFSVLSFSVLGDPFTFYTSKSGLIDSDVHCIERGEEFVWIGTNSGINRLLFKGTKPFKFSKRGTSVPVTALEDDGNFVWAGLKGKGVYKMIKKNYKLIGFRKDVLGDKEIKNIKRIENGLVIFTESKKFTFEFGKEKYEVDTYQNQKDNLTIEINDKILKGQNVQIITNYSQPKSDTAFFKNGIFDFFGVQLCFFDENSMNLPISRVFELKRTSVAILFKTAALRSCKFGMTTKRK